MKRRQQENVAHVLAETRARLAELLPPNHQHTGDANGAAERLLARLVDVEAALRTDAARRGGLVRRASYWRRSRLEMLRHHPSQPLQVPSHYLRTRLPDPAPRVAIVTPSYQQGAFLERTIYSVVSQNYPALDYVVQDGGSRDGSVAVLQRYERYLTAWDSAPDGGQAAAINRGFARCSGEIMAYLNSDDLLLPGALAFVASYLSRHPDVDAVYGNRLMINERDGHVGSWILPSHDDRTLGLFDYVPQETLFWRRRAWEATGACLDERLRFAMDWDLLLRMRDAGMRIVHVSRFLGAFRVHDQQKTSTRLDDVHRETEVILRRLHGRAMSVDEVHARARPYLRRHVARHTLRRVVDRLPLPRSEVRTLPPPV